MSPSPPPSVAVIGGGLAGITAAIALAETGAAVTLLEARPRLGGATCSFARDDLVVDTGQHIYLGCCTAYRGLLDQLGMTAHAPIQDRFDVTVLAPGPRSAGSGGTTPPDPPRRWLTLLRSAGPQWHGRVRVAGADDPRLQAAENHRPGSFHELRLGGRVDDLVHLDVRALRVGADPEIAGHLAAGDG